MPDLFEVLKDAHKKKASDVFIKANAPISFRINGAVRAQESGVLTPDDSSIATS
jgi:Tfp pilus assembly ATPase PilU